MWEAPYIPLSWLREQKVWAKTFFENGDHLNEHDLWLFNVRFEMQRLIIQELREKIVLLQEENEKVLKELTILKKGYLYDSEPTVYDYGYYE